MGLKKQLKKLEDGANEEFAKVRKKLVRTIVSNHNLLVAFLRAVADDDMLTENFVHAVLGNEKLYGLLKHSIESDLAPTTTTLASEDVPAPENAAPTPMTDHPEVATASTTSRTTQVRVKKPKYIGPKDNEFENAHAILAYWKSEGLSNEMAGRLADARMTPHKIFQMENIANLRNKVKRVGAITIQRLQENKEKNTKPDQPSPMPTATNVADLEP